ncbi:MAG: DUF1684 domain-containing protein [Cyclobacteriaceae bacterium]|nr:DUF1684 domain-containing protein [Cyclobacteriaceae bacterium]
MRNIITLIILFNLVIVGCTVKEKSTIGLNTEAFVEEIKEWQHNRNAYQVSEDGWVNLAGLFWLKEGINTFGSGKENDLVFPEGRIAERGGFMLLKQGVVTLESAPGVSIDLNDAAVSSGVLYHPDSSRIIAAHGSLRWFVIRRGDQYGVRLRDFENPLLKSFTSIECFPIDPKWRIEGRIAWADSSRTIEITNVLGQTGPQRSVGTLVFEYDGKEYTLDALDEGGDEFFIIFGDETNARETYGAGRYMYAPVPKEGDRVIIDFNKAYNPPCAFTEFATCPLPPRQNILPFAIPAGEKNYGTH